MIILINVLFKIYNYLEIGIVIIIKYINKIEMEWMKEECKSYSIVPESSHQFTILFYCLLKFKYYMIVYMLIVLFKKKRLNICTQLFNIYLILNSQ
jgi:hypothetical protein